MTQENETTLFWLTKDRFVNAYSCKELGTRKGSMFIDRDNVPEIKKKLKTLLIFS